MQVRKARTLKWLDLSQNRLGSVASTMLDQLTQLAFLNLEDNAITAIADGAFANQGLLFYLRLGRNQLEGSAPVSVLVPSLWGLNLNGNRITDIAAWASILWHMFDLRPRYPLYHPVWQWLLASFLAQ